MFSAVVPGSAWAIGLLIACLALVLAFEFSNGFHDTANAVATVIYTNSLKPLVAVVWSGIMNFVGVLVGGIAVAYALVQLLPPEVLSPPNGGLAVGMLVSLFVTALFWNVGTWWLGIPNSSSHALIGSLIGVAVGNSLVRRSGLGNGVDWHQIWSVLGSLLVSPIVGFGLAFLLYRLIRMLFKDENLYKPPEGEEPPVWWMRILLICTCTGVSFAHGTNDGQKSIGLIMLTIIGLYPATFALNVQLPTEQLHKIGQDMEAAEPLIAQHGDDEKQRGVDAVRNLQKRFSEAKSIGDIPESERPAVRNDINQAASELKTVSEAKGVSDDDKKKAKATQEELTKAVQYAPWWVRIVSALCLGVGTMVGYRRIVHTLGERIGKEHLAPAQGGAAELVAGGTIAAAGFSGFPVSTTHVVTSGIAGTMVGSGAGIQPATAWQIALAWILTLPATIVIAAGLFYLLS